MSFILLHFQEKAEYLFSDIGNEDLIEKYLSIKQELKVKFSVFFQIIRRPLLISLNQVRMILHRLDYAFEKGFNISSQPEMELLLYLSLQRQISEAINFAGGIPNKITLKMPISCDLILFGKKENLTQAITWFSQKISKIGYKKWDQPNQDEINSIIEHYKNYKHLLQDINLHIHNHKEKIVFLENIFNFHALKLFSENIRPTKLYHNNEKNG